MITILYLIDTHVPPLDKPSVGGAEKQLHILASSLDPSSFRPIVVQLITESGSPVATGNFGNVKLLHFPTKRFYDAAGWRQIRRLSSLARQEKVDIVHTFFEKSEAMGWVIKRLAGIPIWITSRRDLGFKRKKIYDLLFRFSSVDCKRCVAVCEAVKEQVVKDEGLPTGKMEVIYNGLDTSPYHVRYDGDALRKELGIDQAAPLVGLIADLNFEIKGHRYFLEAAKIVLDSFPSVEFLLAGDGCLQGKYEKMTDDLGIRSRVHFMGKRTDVPAILSNLTISVLCSTSEGLSNVGLESMAAGKPVIATDIGGNPEMVINGKTGRLVPPADSGSLAEAIVSLLNDPDMCRRMGENGKRQVANRFSIPAMVEGYEHLYRTLATELVMSKSAPCADPGGRTDRVV